MIKKAVTLTLILIGLLVPVSRGLMIEIPYEQLWDKADTVALGSVTGITTRQGDWGII